MKFKGYRRPDGRVGSRNIVALIPTVVCSNDVASIILAQVQGTQAILHHQAAANSLRTWSESPTHCSAFL